MSLKLLYKTPGVILRPGQSHKVKAPKTQEGVFGFV